MHKQLKMNIYNRSISHLNVNLNDIIHHTTHHLYPHFCMRYSCLWWLDRKCVIFSTMKSWTIHTHTILCSVPHSSIPHPKGSLVLPAALTHWSFFVWGMSSSTRINCLSALPVSRTPCSSVSSAAVPGEAIRAFTSRLTLEAMPQRLYRPSTFRPENTKGSHFTKVHIYVTASRLHT